MLVGVRKNKNCFENIAKAYVCFRISFKTRGLAHYANFIAVVDISIPLRPGSRQRILILLSSAFNLLLAYYTQDEGYDYPLPYSVCYRYVLQPWMGEAGWI